MSIQAAFDAFMSEAFEGAVDKSTKASWDGSGYSVELFPDGTYRVLWDNQIGDRYSSRGLILSIPALSSDDWNSIRKRRFYDNAEQAMRDAFQEQWQSAQDVMASL